MTPYWILYAIPAWHLLFEKNAGRHTPRATWILFAVALILMIGLRFEVGGDWGNYIEGLEVIRQMDWSEMHWNEIFDARKEVGYTLISMLALASGWDIYGVNLICAAIFVYGLVQLAKAQPYPWLVVAAATPYLIIVVSMGYTRQAAAIGWLMISFRFLIANRPLAYLLVVTLAGLFHKTAFIFLAMVLFRPTGGWKGKLLGICVLMGLIFGSVVVDQAEYLVRVYVEQTMESEGGMIRVLMNLPAALLFFFYWKKWGKLYNDRWLWAMLAVLSVLSVLLVSFASTAIDRMALYLIPLQLVVYARLPELLGNRTVISVLLLYFAVVQWVWLVFATHAPHWVPYRFFPFEWIVKQL